MKSDRILEEVWVAKDALAKRFDYDINRLAEYLRQKEKEVPPTRGKKKLQTEKLGLRPRKKGAFRSTKGRQTSTR